jgi:hypothetical protein
VKNPKTNGVYGKMVNTLLQVECRPDHFDFIKAGTEIAYVIATDFTGSNGDPSDPKSLHYL